MTRPQLIELSRRLLAAKTRRGVARILRAEIRRHGFDTNATGTWGWYFERFAREFSAGRLPHPVFNMDGNTKLPFAAFSALPLFTCPGAGDCLAWCYSFRAWRYPGGFLRQFQNTWLLKNERGPIRQAWRALPRGITARLYVDGDIETTDTWRFWVAELAVRPDIQAYGYSKSWSILANWRGRWPKNYVLNISEGSKHDGDATLRGAIERLPITRGVFGGVAVGNGKNNTWKGFQRYAKPEYHNAVRAKALADRGEKVFSCPGKCGECRGGNHACGDMTFVVPIMIGVH